MTSIAVVGAGRGLRAAVARRFGAEGLSIAVISRNQDRVDGLALGWPGRRWPCTC